MRTIGLCMLLLVACAPQKLQHSVEVAGEAKVILRTEPNVAAKLQILNRESSITFKCTSSWLKGGPVDISAPLGLISKVCVGDRCDRSGGPVAELTVRSKDFHKLENVSRAYCHVYMPSWFILESDDGPITEYHPEKLVLVLIVPIQTHVEPSEKPSYCNDIVCDNNGCQCTGWY